jgi:hypothetical protein
MSAVRLLEGEMSQIESAEIKNFACEKLMILSASR